MLCYIVVILTSGIENSQQCCRLRDKRFKGDFRADVLKSYLSASRQLLSVPNIVLIVTGIYFALVAGLREGSPYTAVGAILCFISVGLAFEKDLFFAWPFRLATAAFSIVVLLAQLGSDFTVANPSATIVASALINGILFILVLGVLIWTGKDLTTREKKEEEEEEEPESKKKKLTYEI